VLEDGQEQEILAFDEVSLAEPSSSEPDWVRDIAPDVKSNALSDGRIVVLVIDDAMLPSDPRFAFRAKEILREIVKNLGPNDLTAVVLPRDNGNAQDFTTDHARLLTAIDKTSGNTAGNCLFQRYSVSAVSRVTQYLTALPHRRKALMLVSIGVPVDFSFQGRD